MKLLLAALALALLLLGIEEYRINQRDHKISQYKEAVARAEERYKAKDAEYREKEEQIRVRHKEAYDEQQTQIDKLQVVIARERKSAASLRDAFGSYRCPETAGDPQTPTSGPPITDPIAVRSELFGELLEMAGAFAEAADRSRIAGLTCEQAYDALR